MAFEILTYKVLNIFLSLFLVLDIKTIIILFLNIENFSYKHSQSWPHKKKNIFKNIGKVT